MNYDYHMTRRESLKRGGFGIGSLALGHLLSDQSALANTPGPAPLASRPPHFPARAKRMIHLFMNGGPSQVDTFDPKPALKKFEGKSLPIHYETERKTGMALPSPFEFSQHGESGLPISDLFPHTARHADDLCVLRGMHCDVPNHPPSFMQMNCGDPIQMRPSMGSWLTYGLGTDNENPPGFISMCPGGYPSRFGPRNWQSAFLPGAYQGTFIDTQHREVEDLVENIRNGKYTLSEQKRQLSLLTQLNRMHADRVTNDDTLEARIQSFDLAYRMQMEATDAFDLSKESARTRDAYGDTDYGRQLLIARRLLERGVRMVQTWYGKGIPWDDHDDILNHRPLALGCDQAIGALLDDLKQMGLLEDTLVLWGGEFGRTPAIELPSPGQNKGIGNGRDHNNHGFSVWMAGAGVKGGHIHGATDDFGFKAIEGRTHVHDLHATILHLFGLDHTRLTYRYAGRDFRLTDVHGNVIDEIIA